MIHTSKRVGFILALSIGVLLAASLLVYEPAQAQKPEAQKPEGDEETKMQIENLVTKLQEVLEAAASETKKPTPGVGPGLEVLLHSPEQVCAWWIIIIDAAQKKILKPTETDKIQELQDLKAKVLKVCSEHHAQVKPPENPPIDEPPPDTKRETDNKIIEQKCDPTWDLRGDIFRHHRKLIDLLNSDNPNQKDIDGRRAELKRLRGILCPCLEKMRIDAERDGDKDRQAYLNYLIGDYCDETEQRRIVPPQENLTPPEPVQEDSCNTAKEAYEQARAKYFEGSGNSPGLEKSMTDTKKGYCDCLKKNYGGKLPPDLEKFCDPRTAKGALPPVTPTPTPTPTPSPTPTSNPPENKKVALLPGYHVDTNPTNGLFVTTFTTPQGKIKVNLTDDLAAGDTISGTVETEPAGKNDAERAQNQAELNGYVVELEGQKTKVGDKKITCIIPTTLTPEAKTIVLQHHGQIVATTQIPISATQPLAPTQFTLPTAGQLGKPIEITGPCNGVVSPNDYVKMGGEVLPELAESPRKKVVLNTSKAVGPNQQMECKEQGVITQGSFRNLGIALSASKTNLLKGEQTTLLITVSGLLGIDRDARVHCVNGSPGTLDMEGGVEQDVSISPSQVSSSGDYKLNRRLTGIQPGSFQITCSVTAPDGSKPANPKKP